MSWIGTFTMEGLGILATLFVFIVGLFALAVAVMFVADVTQTADAVRRNYPVIGRFRQLFTTLGEFFRQYFFAMDREEMPFNRAERDWVYRSSAGVDNTVAFGSTRNLNAVETTIFVNAPFPPLDEDVSDPPPVVFGPDGPNPYAAASLINISAMSYGAISAPAVKALGKGARATGCWMNTGEGGLAPAHLASGCDIVFQIGTAKYGCRAADGGLDDAKLATIAAHHQVRMVELKLSQGAKPGKGGILPAAKVNAEIAEIRGIPLGQDSISPNRHPEIANVDELLDMIARIRLAAQRPVGFKTVVSDCGWLTELANAIHQRGLASAPDFITVDAGDGGTGAAPMPLMDNVGLPLREALPMLVQVLEETGLRERVKVIASGKLITPADVAWAYCAGADVVTSARGFMFALGCIQSLKCNKNTCPTGITTHDRRLQRGLDPSDKAIRVENFVNKIHYGVGLIAHSCGVPHARALRPEHCRIVMESGVSVPLLDLMAEQQRRRTEHRARRAAPAA